jgi:YVTN family beta-propeller protein
MYMTFLSILKAVRSLWWVWAVVAVIAGVMGCDSADDDDSDDKKDGSSSDRGSPKKDAASRDDAALKATGQMYVAIAGDNEVIIIDEATYKIVSHIPVGVGPAIILSTPDHSKLLTANWTDNTVSAIDVAEKTSNQLQLTGRPYVIAMAPDGERVYAGQSDNKIAVINVGLEEVEKTFDTSGMAASIIVSSDSKTLYVAELTANALRAVSAETGEIIHEPIKVGTAPAWITIGPDGSKVYTMNYNSDDITVVDTETFTVEATVKSGEASKGIIGSVVPDGSRLFVTEVGTGDFIAVDTKTNEIVKKVDLGARPVGVSFSQDSKRVYITDYGVGSLDSPTSDGQTFLMTGAFTPKRDGQVKVFDATTYEQIGETITVGPGPSSIVVHSPID